jgi:flagellar hook assembly protein FlgD
MEKPLPAAVAPAPAPPASGRLQLEPGEKIDFGTAAVEVVIHDAQGDLVFTAARQGAGAVLWDGNDASGKRVKPGLYMSCVRDAAGNKVYKPVEVR